MYFNEKHERTGSLFQGTYKARHTGRDEYLKYLYAYIHLNPAKLYDRDWKERGPKDLRKLKERIAAYPFSSIREYRTGEFSIVDPDPFPGYFESANEFDQYIDSWVRFKDGYSS